MQLRECLESEVYELFHKKLTEQALIKDPKFLWCCHVSMRVYKSDFDLEFFVKCSETLCQCLCPMK